MKLTKKIVKSIEEFEIKRLRLQIKKLEKRILHLEAVIKLEELTPREVADILKEVGLVFAKQPTPPHTDELDLDRRECDQP